MLDLKKFSFIFSFCLISFMLLSSSAAANQTYADKYEGSIVSIHFLKGDTKWDRGNYYYILMPDGMWWGTVAEEGGHGAFVNDGWKVGDFVVIKRDYIGYYTVWNYTHPSKSLSVWYADGYRGQGTEVKEQSSN